MFAGSLKPRQSVVDPREPVEPAYGSLERVGPQSNGEFKRCLNNLILITVPWHNFRADIISPECNRRGS